MSLGLFVISAAAALWAIAAIVASWLFQAGITPFELTTSRAVIAAVGLGVLSQGWRSYRKSLDWRVFALGLALALVTVCYYVAIARLPVAVAIVIQYMAPALVVLWVSGRSGRLPSPRVGLALVAALIGVVLVSGVSVGHGRLDPIGLLMAGGSTLCFAAYTLLSESIVGLYGPMGVMFRAFTVSSLFWLAFQCSQGLSPAFFVPLNLAGIVFVGIGGTLMPFSLFCWGIQQVRPDRGAIAATLEPVIASVLAWVWLGQTLSVWQVGGGVLVLVAVLCLQRLDRT
ncbi:MAG TPA: EamA family transporter [Chroococcidiopsis sp.]